MSFQDCLRRGQFWERVALQLAALHLGTQSQGKCSSYDVALPAVRFEVKYDRESSKYGNFFIEYAQENSNGRRPSGVETSESDYYAIVKPIRDAFEINFIATEILKAEAPKLSVKERSTWQGKNGNSDGAYAYSYCVPCVSLAEYFSKTVVLSSTQVKALYMFCYGSECNLEDFV